MDLSGREEDKSRDSRFVTRIIILIFELLFIIYLKAELLKWIVPLILLCTVHMLYCIAELSVRKHKSLGFYHKDACIFLTILGITP
jgi:hypothetical protein